MRRSGPAWGRPGVDVAEALRQSRARFAGGAAAVARVLAAATAETTLAQRIWTVPLLADYGRKQQVLVGDAAHGMTPNLGGAPARRSWTPPHWRSC